MVDNKKKTIVTFFIILIFIVLAFGSTESDESTSSTSDSSSIDIGAAVSFDGTQFILTNNDSFNWYDTEIDINGGVFKSGYTLKAHTVKAGQTYTVGAMQFANSKGERFNPFQMKPQKVWINCKVKKGDKVVDGFWSGSWE